MDFISPFLPGYLSWSLNILILVSTLVVGIKTDWARTIKNQRHNVWLSSIFILSMIWMLRASLPSGLNAHLLGTMLITLMFGWRLGVLAMTLVCLLVSLWGQSSLVNVGVSVLINAYLSVSICYLIFLVIEAFMPRHLFVYLYLSAFFGSAINFIIVGTVSASLLAIFDVFDWYTLINEFLPYYYLLGFAEAFITGGLITVFVVYRPQWVFSFRDERYLEGK